MHAASVVRPMLRLSFGSAKQSGAAKAITTLGGSDVLQCLRAGESGRRVVLCQMRSDGKAINADVAGVGAPHVGVKHAFDHI